MDLNGRKALITGGGTGLGKEIALALASRGVDVAVGYSRSATEADATCAAVRACDRQGEAIQADLGDAEQAERLISEACHRLGGLDILINSAGTTVWVDFPNLDEVGVDAWDNVFNLNLRAPFLCSRAAARRMTGDQGGAIVNISSLAGLRPSGSSLPYAVSKAALNHLTRCLAAALAPRVRVNAVAPASLATAWGEHTGRPTEDGSNERSIPLRDVVNAVLFLLESEQETGQILPLDGGRLVGR